METLQMPQLKEISHVRVVEWHHDHSQESEVNEAIKLGWQLLLVQPGEFHSSFVLGWNGSETPPQTAWQKRCAQYAEALRSKIR